MWPAKQSLGAQLAFGVSGNAIVAPGTSGAGELSLRPQLRFARLRDGFQLHEVQNSTTVLSEPVNQKADNRTVLTNAFDEIVVDPLLAEALHAEADPLENTFVHDPSVTDTCIVFDFEAGKISVSKLSLSKKAGLFLLRCLAYVVGPSTLHIKPMWPKRKNFIDTADASKLLKQIFTLPERNAHGTSLELPFPIEQLEYSERLRILAVRGRQRVAFLRLSLDTHSKELNVAKAPLFAYTHSPMAHFAFEAHRFAIIDISGRITFYHLDMRTLVHHVELYSFQLGESRRHDFSNFRRICWPAGHEHVLVFSRRSIDRVCRSQSEHDELVSLHASSRVRDVRLIDKEVFLLTSQEIVWLRVTPDLRLERLLSWKHYFDEDDTTFRLSVTAFKEDFLCAVYSKHSPIIVIFHFGNADGMPSLKLSPQIINSRHCHIRQLLILSSTLGPSVADFMFNLVIIEETYRITATSFSFLPHKAFKAHSKSAEDLQVEATKQKAVKYRYQYMSRNERMLVYRAYGSDDLPELNTTEADNEAEAGDFASQDVDSIQKFAFKLGADLDALFSKPVLSSLTKLPTYQTLATIGEHIPRDIENTSEFDSMISQLTEFYTSQNLTLARYPTSLLSKLLPGFSNVQDTSATTIEDGIPADSLRAQAALVLFATLLRVARDDLQEQYSRIAAAELSKCSEDVKELLGDWEDVSAVSEQPEAGLPLRSTTKSQVAVDPNPPFSTQKESQVTKPKKLLSQRNHAIPRISHSRPASQIPLASSQVSSQTPLQSGKRASSQIPSQKRKKKKGGFA